MTASRRRRAPRRTTAGLAAAFVLAGTLSACSGATGSEEEPERQSKARDEVAAAADELRINTSVKRQGVPVDRLVRVRATQGKLSKVEVRAEDGSSVAGSLGKAGKVWRATTRLEPGTSYSIRATGHAPDGTKRHPKRRFATEDLTLAEQTYASIAPLQGETVGIGMPVVVKFDLPVTRKAAFEKQMSVTSTPQQKGSWHWISDRMVHWRPAKYWQAGTDVKVDVNINGLAAGDGIYGQESRHISFHVGDAVVSKVNARTHQMQTFINGKLMRTMPITTGKDGFTTRSGVKVIMEKFRYKRMNSETIGIDPDSAEGYDLEKVEYAMRLTNSGEFMHAAPWSVGSQGSANVSHGCTGLSTANAKWIYDRSKRGDVVEFTGTDRPMTLTNGYGDWNASFGEYAEGSAL